MRRLAYVTAALLLTTTAFAARGGPPMGGPRMGGPMERNLFPPELVLTNQMALGVSAEQLSAIKKQVNDTHSRVLDVQVDLHRVTEQLQAALDAPKVDEAAVLALASQAMDLEKQVKTAHLTLMIRVKNLLTPEQQEKARALKPQRRQGNRPDDDRE